MNALIVIFSILVVFGTCSASIHVNYSHPQYPKKCYVRSNLILSEGEVALDPKKNCAKLLCHEEGMAVLATCDDYRFLNRVYKIVKEKKGCHLGRFLFPNEPYPRCCERSVICP